MAKSYKKKHEEEVIVTEDEAISKKELYDLEKKKKLELKEKAQKSKNKGLKVKNSNKEKLGARIFAIVMLVLMIGSVIVSALATVFR